MHLNIIKKLFGIEGSCGYSESELSCWVERYGAVPKALKEYYIEVGKHQGLNNAQDFLIPPSQFADYADVDAEHLIFYSENQGVILWGIQKGNMEQDNPPVYENYGGDEWFLTAESLSVFWLSMAHLQAVLALEYRNEECVDITGEQRMAIANAFLSKNADSKLYTGVSFYGNDEDTVVAVMKNHESFILMYASSNERHFDETDSKINGILSS